MTLTEFKSLKSAKHLPVLLQALWHDLQGNWQTSHTLAQEVNTPEGCWVHAYLHRKEGDASNATYWYRQAGKPVPVVTLEKEWEEITKTLIHTATDLP